MQDMEEAELLVEQIPGPTSTSSKLLRPLVITVALVSLGVVAMLGATGPLRAAARDDQELASSFVRSQTCYGYSGGTCALSDCNKERGAACSGGRCICETGCAGADGMCHNGKSNDLVASGFILVNKKWSRYAMYFQGMSLFGQLKTTKAMTWTNLGKDRFSLYRLPGNLSSPKFLVGSVAYPEQVAYIGSTTGTAISGHGLYAANLDDGHPVGPDRLACTVCYEASKKAIMIGDKDGNYWSYIHHLTWLVYGSSSSKEKVGDGGLWVPDPPFEADEIAMLPKC